LADIFRANVADSTLTSFVFENHGTSEKVRQPSADSLCGTAQA